MKRSLLFLTIITLLIGATFDVYAFENFDIPNVEGHYLEEEDLLINYVNPSVTEPWERTEEWIPDSAEEAPEELIEQINCLGQEIVEFLNLKYDLDWNFTEIPVLVSYGDYMWGGSYITTNKSLYINANSFLGNIDEPTPGLEWLISHELIHAITDSNRGTPFFYKRISDTEVMGIYLHEAVTELLTELFMEERKGVSSKDVYDRGTCSGYIDIIYYLKATESTFKGTIEDILKDNMSKLEERMRNKVNDEFIFERWICLLDITQLMWLENDNAFICVEAMTEYLWYMTEDDEALLSTINEFFDNIFGYYTKEYQFDEVADAIITMDILSQE